MGNFLRSGCRSSVGIDIQSSEVNLFEVSLSPRGYRVEGIYHEAFCSNSSGSNVLDSQSVSESIRRAVVRGSINSKQAVLAMPDAAVIFKTIAINPGFTTREIEEFIRLQSHQWISSSSESINIDFQIVGPSKTQAEMLEVLVIMSRMDQVRERVLAVEHAGFKVKIMDVESYAMLRVVQFLRLNQSAHPLVLVNIGRLVIRLFILQGKKIIFLREEVLSCPLEMDGVVLQISRMVQVFFSSSHYTHIEQIVLAGVGANDPQLPILLHGKLGITTIVANPVASFKLNPKLDQQYLIQCSSAMMMACGLALRQFS